MNEENRKPQKIYGRPKIEPTALRARSIGVKVSEAERLLIEERASFMGMKPSTWLRESALSRRLPSPPVAEINRKAYGELGKLAANVNQLVMMAHNGSIVKVDDSLLLSLLAEIKVLRLNLLGLEVPSDDR